MSHASTATASRDRVLTALRRGRPDRVPIFELMIDPRVIEALRPGGSYADFCERFPIDMVITPTPSSMYRKMPAGERGGVPHVRTEWGELRAETGDLVPIPVDGFPIRTRADLDAYHPPDPLAPRRFAALRGLLDRFRGIKAVGIHLHDAFSYPTYLMGMENLLTALHTDPELVRALVDLGVRHQAAMAREACALGADFVLLGDDYCDTRGPLMSPRHFETFFLPGIRRLVEAVHAAGGFVVKHTDGNVLPILDLLIEAGIDALHPCDPSAGLDLPALQRRWGRRLCVIGNVDTGPLLSEGTPAQVRYAVARLLRDAGPAGGFILSSSNTIHRGVRPENYRAMLEAASQDAA